MLDAEGNDDGVDVGSVEKEGSIDGVADVALEGVIEGSVLSLGARDGTAVGFVENEGIIEGRKDGA